MVIKINISNKRAMVEGSPIIVCGNSGYIIEFAFDAEWDDHDEKTARFVYVQDGVPRYKDVHFSGNIVEVPPLSGVMDVRVGVYAGGLCMTTQTRIQCEPSVRCGAGSPADPQQLGAE